LIMTRGYFTVPWPCVSVSGQEAPVRCVAVNIDE
ncbi:MAG: hypothetical protein ACI8V4_001384, partial [Ilumatobacter sp.]